MRTKSRKVRLLIAVTLIASTSCVRPPVIEPPEVSPNARRSRILAADGSVLATLFIENRSEVTIDDIPAHLLEAVVAAEDQRFWSHKGFDGKAVTRAAIANAASKRTVQGGSTITQQYVKNAFYPVGRKRTLEQKIREAQLAWKLETELTKKQILERYLNTVYFGDGAYGVKAAAEQYFRKDVSQLALGESAMLAAVIRAPENYSPRIFPNLALARRNFVLRRMEKLGMIPPSDASATEASPLGISEPPLRDIKEPYVVDYVKRFVIDHPAFGRDQAERASLLFRGGVDFKTSIDLGLQQAARDSVAQILNRPGDPEAALVAIDPRTGHVLAMSGGRNYGLSQVNLALGRKGGGLGRQPGSAFKPFVLATAIEDGLLPSTMYASSPPVIRISRKEVWRPRNNEGAGGGPMSLERAMVNSVNGVFARLGMDVGPARVANTAKRMGISYSPLRGVPSISLGTQEVAPIEMASAYGTLANYGIHMEPSPLVTAVAPGGQSIPLQSTITRALDPGNAYLVTDVLRKVIEDGTGTRAQIGRPAAGKTGTSQDNADAWFVGYTPELVVAVWVGYPEGRVPMRNVHGSTVFGGTLPAMIWREFMLKALADKPALNFELPTSDLVEIDIDPRTGLLAGPYCSGRQTVQMLRQLAPTTSCAKPPDPTPAPPPSTPSSTVTPEPSPSPTQPPPSSPATEPSASPT